MALQAQNQGDELIAFLDGLSGDSRAGVAADVAIIRAQLAQGNFPAAMERADILLKKAPDDPDVRLIYASVLGVGGRGDEEVTILRDILSKSPGQQAAWAELYKATLRGSDDAAAGKVLDEGLAANPDSPTLQWIKAGRLERAGDLDGAIAIYEALYGRSSDNVVLANNLASLISSAHDDPESLQRAFSIARRLRDSEFPPFQDTYGWIAFRLGNLTEALPNLEKAAVGLPDDPAVQYHLGRVYAAQSRPDEAMEQFRKAKAKIDPNAPAPVFAQDLEDRLAGRVTEPAKAD